MPDDIDRAGQKAGERGSRESGVLDSELLRAAADSPAALPHIAETINMRNPLHDPITADDVKTDLTYLADQISEREVNGQFDIRVGAKCETATKCSSREAED